MVDVSGVLSRIQSYCRSPYNFYMTLAILITFDIFLSMVILKFVPYTEIDWVAYMQEVGGFLAGERDYTKLKGDTGPLVYPAGFVYIYSILHWVTNSGTNLILAQIIFAVIYILTNLITTVVLYGSGLLSLWTLPIMYFSKRLHSIYMLRCFNDCIAMAFVYLAIFALLRGRWYWGSALISFALSVKMNILLFLPGLAILFLLKYPRQFKPLFLHAGVIFGVQIALATPFLIDYPVEYFSKSFEFGRIFTFIWTVNWKFLPEDIFVGKTLARTLLLTHLGLLLVVFALLDGKTIWDLWFGSKKSASASGLAPASVSKPKSTKSPRSESTIIHTRALSTLTSSVVGANGANSNCQHDVIPMGTGQNEIIGSGSKNGIGLGNDVIVTRLVLSNFLGVVCAKSLHYQFYSWYAHQLPLILGLMWGLGLPQDPGLFLTQTKPTHSAQNDQNHNPTPSYSLNWLFCFQLVGAYLTFGIIEYTWNVFPSTPKSSLIWQIAHWSVLLVLIITKLPALRSTAVVRSRGKNKSA